MSAPTRVVFLRGPEDDAPNEPSMKFRLTYEGELRPTGNEPYAASHTDKLATHKHGIRRAFHRQLKQLWDTNKFLKEHRVYPGDYPPKQRAVANDYAIWGGAEDQKIPLQEAIARLYPMFGYRFVPLVCADFSLLCSLDILFLRRDVPGSALHAGDIDNRIKTVIDALRLPANANDLSGNETPTGDEEPFFCLMEDDKQVSHFAVETDTLLDPPDATEADLRKAKIVVTVELRPYYATMFNLSFA